MTKYIAKFDGIEVKFNSKRVITHAIIVSGKCFDSHWPQDGKAGIFATVSRADLVDASVKKAARVYENAYVVEVEIVG